jgi:hypothetical protein
MSQTKFGLITGFIEHLLIVPTSNYSSGSEIVKRLILSVNVISNLFMKSAAEMV